MNLTAETRHTVTIDLTESEAHWLWYALKCAFDAERPDSTQHNVSDLANALNRACKLGESKLYHRQPAPAQDGVQR